LSQFKCVAGFTGVQLKIPVHAICHQQINFRGAEIDSVDNAAKAFIFPASDAER
jgi:hypothetical protein